MSEAPQGPERPAAAGSPLASFRARREQAKKKLHLDLRVPRYAPPIVVRYAPLDQRVLEAANKRAAELRESKDPDATIVGNAVSLTHACLGVYDEVDGRLVPVGGLDAPPRFDEQLAALLELPEGSGAVEVVRALYLAEGDIIAAAAELAEWSAQAERRAREDTEGN